MIMSSLYYGSICPMEDAVSGDPQYRELNQQIKADLDELEVKLTKEQMALVNQLHNHINGMNCYECEAKFKLGLTMGILLMQEVNTVTNLPKD